MGWRTAITTGMRPAAVVVVVFSLAAPAVAFAAATPRPATPKAVTDSTLPSPVITDDASLRSWKVPSATRQLVVGVVSGWDSSWVTLARFERRSASAPWRQVGERVRGRLGRKGLVWGRGVSPRTPSMSDKREGDNRSPAGAFSLKQAFGYDSAWERRTKLDYVTVGTRDLLVEDPSSPQYNTHVRLDHDAASTFEIRQRMTLNDSAHRLQVLVGHNTDPVPLSGKGSAIMLHIWRNGGGLPTAGCTAMADADLESMVSWFDPTLEPLYVLLPRAEYQALAPVWQLPGAPRALAELPVAATDTTLGSASADSAAR